ADYPKALSYYFKALKANEELGRKNGIAINLGHIGSLYTSTKKYAAAEDYLLRALALDDSIGALDQTKYDENAISELYAKTGKHRLALLHYKKYIVARDSISNEENTKKTVQTSMQYEFDKKEAVTAAESSRRDAVAAAESRKQKIITGAILVGLLLVVVFAGFVVRSLRLTQKQKKLIEQKEIETQHQKHLVEEKHKEITDSINYAERIQRSFLATKELLDENLGEYFVLFKPKDVVSGDFYWAAKTVSSSGVENFLLATADSTGHGVPGAIMSVLNISSLEKAVEQGLTNPAEILNYTRKTIIERLKKDGSAEGGKDGMDCSLISFDFSKKQLNIACANNHVWIVRGIEVIEIKPDKMPVGKHDKDTIAFTQHEIQLQKGDVVYALTDGFPDQFGGEKGKKFMVKNLRDLLASNAQLPVQQQKELLETTFTNWMGNLEQVDDVTVFGVRV
ncbi:MAG: SpoIIE family protein phosphatase, partial [Bacteroidia bacterium]